MEGTTLEGGDDGVSHVGYQYGHGRYGNERPYNEEGFSGVACGAEVAIADGEQGYVAEIESLEISNALGFGFCFPKPNGTYAPEQANCKVISAGVRGMAIGLMGRVYQIASRPGSLKI